MLFNRMDSSRSPTGRVRVFSTKLTLSVSIKLITTRDENHFQRKKVPKVPFFEIQHLKES